MSDSNIEANIEVNREETAIDTNVSITAGTLAEVTRAHLFDSLVESEPQLKEAGTFRSLVKNAMRSFEGTRTNNRDYGGAYQSAGQRFSYNKYRSLNVTGDCARETPFMNRIATTFLEADNDNVRANQMEMWTNCAYDPNLPGERLTLSRLAEEVSTAVEGAATTLISQLTRTNTAFFDPSFLSAMGLMVSAGRFFNFSASTLFARNALRRAQVCPLPEPARELFGSHACWPAGNPIVARDALVFPYSQGWNGVTVSPIVRTLAMTRNAFQSWVTGRGPPAGLPAPTVLAQSTGGGSSITLVPLSTDMLASPRLVSEAIITHTEHPWRRKYFLADVANTDGSVQSVLPHVVWTCGSEAAVEGPNFTFELIGEDLVPVLYVVLVLSDANPGQNRTIAVGGTGGTTNVPIWVDGSQNPPATIDIWGSLDVYDNDPAQVRSTNLEYLAILRNMFSPAEEEDGMIIAAELTCRFRPAPVLYTRAGDFMQFNNLSDAVSTAVLPGSVILDTRAKLREFAKMVTTPRLTAPHVFAPRTLNDDGLYTERYPLGQSPSVRTTPLNPLSEIMVACNWLVYTEPSSFSANQRYNAGCAIQEWLEYIGILFAGLTDLASGLSCLPMAAVFADCGFVTGSIVQDAYVDQNRVVKGAYSDFWLRRNNNTSGTLSAMTNCQHSNIKFDLTRTQATKNIAHDIALWQDAYPLHVCYSRVGYMEVASLLDASVVPRSGIAQWPTSGVSRSDLYSVRVDHFVGGPQARVKLTNSKLRSNGNYASIAVMSRNPMTLDWTNYAIHTDQSSLEETGYTFTPDSVGVEYRFAAALYVPQLLNTSYFDWGSANNFAIGRMNYSGWRSWYGFDNLGDKTSWTSNGVSNLLDLSYNINNIELVAAPGLLPSMEYFTSGSLGDQRGRFQ